MGLSATDRVAINKSRTTGASELAVPISDGGCLFLASVVATDLGFIEHFPELNIDPPPFFSEGAIHFSPEIDCDFMDIMERLADLDRDSVTFFACLAALHGRRMKYHNILKCQPLPTIEQVGPRGLIQFGTMPSPALAALLFWRKWLYDIDNRAAQETGYIFEPVIANAVGGVPYGSKKSPIKRQSDKAKGRQVDCIREKFAYEIKMRVTIAASGQGRWREELDFPADARTSGYVPVLIVFDGTPNDKLAELQATFLANGGLVHIGKDAWSHLALMAGRTMSVFLEKYVRVPIQSLLEDSPQSGGLPPISFEMTPDKFTINVEDKVEVARDAEWRNAHEASDRQKAKELGRKVFIGHAAAYLSPNTAYEVVNVTRNGGLRLRGFLLSVSQNDVRLSG